MKRALLLGITGQDGSYLAELLLSKGYGVHGIIRRASTFNTSRIDHIFDRLNLHFGDLSDGSGLARLLAEIQPDEVYNLAAQSHVKVSFDAPEYTTDINATGTVRLLEAARLCLLPTVKFYQASSSEMYGKVRETPQTETTPFHPRSPYGCAKVFSYWQTVNYRESYGLHASNGILFNHESLTAETPIVFRRNDWIGISEIQELVPHRTNPKYGTRYQNIPKSLDVWDGDKWSKVICATAHWNNGEKDVYRVEARGGTYCSTGDHVSFREGRVEEKTSNLKAGDRLQLFPMPVDSRQRNSCIAKEEAEFLGMMVGAENLLNTTLKEPVKARLEELFEMLTGGKIVWEESSEGASRHFSDAKLFFYLWHFEIYNGRDVKRVPARILNGSKQVQRAFWQGYQSVNESWVTDSPPLAAGLWFLAECLGIEMTFFGHDYQGRPMLDARLEGLPLEEVMQCEKIPHIGWLFDLATESGTFSAGIGHTWVHNSPRRGETFVTRKITKAVANIVKGKQQKLFLGNLDAKRDWGYAGDYAEGMWRMLQQDQPDDYILATGETHSVKEFLEIAFGHVNLRWEDYVEIDPKYFRPAEVDLLLGNPEKAKQKLGWVPKTGFRELVTMMVDSDLKLFSK